jgi:4-hydroxybenzoyl-CoA reductase subunit beta
MLRLPPFELRRAASAAEAAAILAGEGAAERDSLGRPSGRQIRLVAGGTDLWPNMKRRHQHADTVVSLRGARELVGISANGTASGHGELRLGAMTTLTALAGDAALRARYPALAKAVASISTPVLRNMGTLGGNLCLDTRCTYYNQSEEWRRSIDYCMKEVGTVCWVAPGSPRCWAVSASDSAPMLCALKARVRLVSSAGERAIAAEELFHDDGIAYLTKRPDEVLAEVLLPPEAEHGGADAPCRAAYWKLRRRGSIDFAVLTAAVALWTEGGAPDAPVSDARIYLGAVASFPSPASEAAATLIGRPLTAETIAEAAALARKAATPLDNTDYQAQWRGTMVGRYVEAALRECAGLDTERLAPRHRLPVL